VAKQQPDCLSDNSSDEYCAPVERSYHGRANTDTDNFAADRVADCFTSAGPDDLAIRQSHYRTHKSAQCRSVYTAHYVAHELSVETAH